MNLDIYLVGVGGQGVLTIAELIMAAAMKRGIPCNFFPTKGMAQRGGFVKAQLRLGEEKKGPDIMPGGADVVIAMEQSEALKAVDYCKEGGGFIVYGYRFLPTDVMLKRAPYPEWAEVEAEIKKRTDQCTFIDPAKLFEGGADNIYLLSAAQKHTALGAHFTAEELLEAIYERFPKGKEANGRSFALGQE